MFKFLFSKKPSGAAETQRQTVERTVEELNAVLKEMAEKPVVGVDLNSGLITIDLPEQMPDEALALPAPDATPESAKDGPKDDTKDGAEKEAA